MNPLGNMPQRSTPPQNQALQSLADIIDFAQTFKSPDAFMQAMKRENPNMYQYLVQLNQQIKNPMQTASQMLMQNGITPEQFNALMKRR